MAAITAAMVGELRAQDRRTNDGMQKSTDRSRRRHGAVRKRSCASSWAARHRKHRHASPPKAWWQPTSPAASARWSKSTRNRLRRQERRLPGTGQQRCPLVAEHNPADVAALLALPLDGKTLDDVRAALIGKIGENMIDPPLPAFRNHRQAGFVPARHAHRRDRRIRRRRRASRQGRGHAHRRHEASVAVVGPSASRTDRKRAFGCRN